MAVAEVDVQEQRLVLGGRGVDVSLRECDVEVADGVFRRVAGEPRRVVVEASEIPSHRREARLLQERLLPEVVEVVEPAGESRHFAQLGVRRDAGRPVASVTERLGNRRDVAGQPGVFGPRPVCRRGQPGQDGRTGRACPDVVRETVRERGTIGASGEFAEKRRRVPVVSTQCRVVLPNAFEGNPNNISAHTLLSVRW
ncbi:hypothetical protein HSB1_32280 [Halogranum salarium B-1]|uniref:Uncharacterized protein n=1 Tax=Halogranum salarium B-1 TaxID=1210908 RepID=J2ZDK4_9EURY|nr:hypothetical protein HSB1_32280 [Halogranum salarium B-1]